MGTRARFGDFRQRYLLERAGWQGQIILCDRCDGM